MTVAAAEEGRLPWLERGAEHELERLYGKHAQEIRRYVLMVLRNRNDTEDIVQQTFLKALRALQQGVRPERPHQWLVAIAHNECRMLFRRAARRPVEVELELAGQVGGRADDGADVSAEAIRQALGQLAPNQRAALVMRELDDRSYAEIAESLELTESAVETLLFRARRALREQLETTGSGCEDAQALIAADSLDDASRRRLRAHVRTCHACATLEHRRRGRLAAAARKVAALFPAPSWLSSLLGGGATKAVVAVTATAVAATGSVEVAKTHAHKPKPKPALALLHRDPVLRTAVSHATATATALSLPAAARAQVAVATIVAREGRLAAKPLVASAETRDTKTAPVAAVEEQPPPAAATTTTASDVSSATPAQPAKRSQAGEQGRIPQSDRPRHERVVSLPSHPKVDAPAKVGALAKAAAHAKAGPPAKVDLPAKVDTHVKVDPPAKVDPHAKVDSPAKVDPPGHAEAPSLPEPPALPGVQPPAVPPGQVSPPPGLTKP